jgi:nucleoside 2-deoxyribosyltransferase
MKKKIIVCGSIGYGGIDTIKEIRDLLRKNYFNIIDHISKEDMDYTDIKDFRDDKSLSEKIVKHDLEYIDQADIIVVITERPSFGTAIEQYHAYNKKKDVVLFSEKPVPTPWPIHFSTYIAKSKEELIKILIKINQTK